MPWSMLYVYCYRYNNLLINEYLCSFDNDMKSAMETFFFLLLCFYIRKEVEEKQKKYSHSLCVLFNFITLLHINKI